MAITAPFSIPAQTDDTLSAPGTLPRAVSLVLVTATAVVALTVICGWITRDAAMCRFFIGSMEMKFNAALALAACAVGVSAFLLAPERTAVPRIAGIAMAAVGAATAVEYLFGVNLHIDQVVMRDWISPTDAGRISPQAALHCIAAGAVVALLNVDRPAARRAFQIIAWIAVATSALNLAAALFRGVFLVLTPFTRLAEVSAGCFVAFDVALLFAQADEGLIALLFADSVGGRITRRFLPFASVLPAMIVVLRLTGELHGLYDERFGSALSSVSLAALLVAATFVFARQIHLDDVRRRAAENELRETFELLTSRYDELLLGKSDVQPASMKALAQQLAETSRELEAFTYSVSHDLRAPLRALDGFSRELLSSYSDALDDRGQHYLRRVRAASQRMGELIDDMLRLSRVSRAQMNVREVDVSAMACEVVAELRERDPKRAVAVTIARDLRVRADRELLRLALVNLIGNAWKFTSKRDLAEVTIESETSADATTIVVRDNGDGFDAEYAPKLFTAFQRLHSQSEFEGSGIGLAIVKRIATRHGGEVFADAIRGCGATFRLRLPSSQRTPE